jgi:transcriptional regulator with XRE-family HTH domain
MVEMKIQRGMDMEKEGEKLIKIASKMKLEDFLRDIAEYNNPSQVLDDYMTEKQMTISQIAHRAGIDENYCGKILNGKRINPSRDYLILIGVALGLNIKQLNLVLRGYGKAELSPKNSKRDAIIFHGIANKKDKKEINFDLEREKQEVFK